MGFVFTPTIYLDTNDFIDDTWVDMVSNNLDYLKQEVEAVTQEQVIVSHEEAAGTNSGVTSGNGGTYTIRKLNTVISWDGSSVGSSISWFSLSANQMILNAGSYLFCDIMLVVNNQSNPTFQSRGRIRNVTDSTNAALGFGLTGTNDTLNDLNHVKPGLVTIATQKVFELQFEMTGSLAQAGGLAYNTNAQNEIYSSLRIVKIT